MSWQLTLNINKHVFNYFPFSGLKGVQKNFLLVQPSHSLDFVSHHSSCILGDHLLRYALVVMTYRKVPLIRLWCIRVSMATHFPSRSIGIEIWMMFSWIKLRLFEIETVISVSILHPGF